MVEQVGEIIIRNASPEKFSVKHIQTNDILNYTVVEKHYKKKTCLSDNSYGRNVHQNFKLQLQISKFSHIEYSTTFHGNVLVQKFIDDVPEYFSLRKNIDVQLTLDNVLLAYHDKVPILDKTNSRYRKMFAIYSRSL